MGRACPACLVRKDSRSGGECGLVLQRRGAGLQGASSKERENEQGPGGERMPREEQVRMDTEGPLLSWWVTSQGQKASLHFTD